MDENTVFIVNAANDDAMKAARTIYNQLLLKRKVIVLPKELFKAYMSDDVKAIEKEN